jgi:Zn-dependent protease
VVRTAEHEPTGLRIGRVAGAPVILTPSVGVILALLAWSLAAAQLPEAAPGRSDLAYAVVGMLTSAVFLATLLAHEASHALVARRHGIAVRSITLWLFGGVARLDAAAAGAATELRVAVAGPLASIGVAFGAGALAIAAEAVDASDLAVAALWWLAVVNGLLAGFNLLPAFPLDGGRVYRALRWRRSGDELDATRHAVALGRTISLVLMAVGAAEFLLGGLLSGLWLVLIGWFVRAAGDGEAAAVEARAALGERTVARVMTPDPTCVEGTSTVAELLEHWVLGTRHTAFPVRDGHGGIAGLVTLDQIRAVPNGLRHDVTVGQIAVPLADVLLAVPGDLAADLAIELSAAPGRRALVFDGDRLVGIVTGRDLLAASVADT